MNQIDEIEQKRNKCLYQGKDKQVMDLTKQLMILDFEHIDKHTQFLDEFCIIKNV